MLDVFYLYNVPPKKIATHLNLISNNLRSLTAPLNILDLFSGMGGLGYGFARAGFQLTGVDIDSRAGASYSLNRIGKFICADLTHFEPKGDFDIIMGGPPCQPWSNLNIRKRNALHPLHRCLWAFFKIARQNQPLFILLENVPGLGREPGFLRELKGLKAAGYSVHVKTVRYSDYGAATSRKRLFVLAVRKDLKTDAGQIFDSIRPRTPTKIKEIIWDLRNEKWDPSIDHVWTRAATVQRYQRYYETGKYGWYILDWEKPAPSFGNISKTYILHPDSFNGGITRPISVREALRIIGFPDSYRFPPRVPLTAKYQMVADAVSPVFSLKLARAIKCVLD
jgi:DNA (cytosine-5)-methyltransferase 1